MQQLFSIPICRKITPNIISDQSNVVRPVLEASAYRKPLGATTKLHFQPNHSPKSSTARTIHTNRARTEEELERHNPYKKNGCTMTNKGRQAEGVGREEPNQTYRNRVE